tara:strand:- start:325 stop:3990 length:3666 start_codon:yes stop_codon:yes gene_type:complete
MAIKIRLPNGRFIKVDTDDMNVAQKTAAQYYNSGEAGFVDSVTQNMASESDKNNFDYESGVNAPWLRTKLGAMETQGGKERVLEEAVGSDGFTRNSKGDLALTPRGLKKLGIKPTSNKYVVIDESGFSFNDFADFSGILGPIVGSIAGSIFTRGKLKPRFPGLKDVSVKQLGVISAGTGVGAAGGKGVEEGIEYVAGLQDNTPGELASLLATEAAIGAGGEALFGLGGKLLKYTFGQKALSKGKLGAEDLKMASAISKTGVVDSKTGKRYKGAAAIAAMDSPLAGLLQGIAETVSKYQGRKIGVRNVLATDAKNVFRSTNDLTAGFDKEIDDLIKTGFGDSVADVAAGKKLGASISRAFKESEKKLNTANSNVRKMMDDVLGDFDAFAESATTQAGEEIRTLTAQGYNAWYDAQSKLYESTGKFFEIPRNLSDDILSFEAFGGPGLGIQAKFIDSTPLKEYIRIIAGDALDASGKLNADKAGAQLADLQKLIDKTGQNLSLKELLELRSGLASANRITETSKEFASIAAPDRSKLISIIDESLRRLENGDDIAFNQLQQFFEKNLTKSQDFIDASPAEKTRIKNLPTIDKGDKLSSHFKVLVDSQKFKTGQAVVSYQNKQMQEALEPLIKEISDSSNQLYATQSRLNKLNLEKYENEDIFFSDQYLDLLKTEKVLNIRIPEIAKRIDEIANSQSFVTPKKLLNQLELDEAYNNKVIKDITENNKIDPRKLQAQMQSIRIANDFYSKGMEAFDQGLYKNLLNDVAAGGLDIDKILTQVVMKKNNGDQVKRLFDTLDVDTAAFRKQRFEGSGRVDRSKAPTRSALEFSDTQRKILADAEIDVKDPVFKNKEQVQGILQKEFLRDIVTRVQKGSDIVNYKQIANTIEGYGTTADTLFGPTGKRELVKSLREADQFVNVGTVDELDDLLSRTSNVDNVIEDLTAKVTAQADLDEIAKLDVFKRIQNGTIDSENIVNTLFKSGNSEEIAAVKQLLGPESVEFKEFQTAAMRKILNDYVNPGDEVIEKLFKDGKFYDAILSPNGYGQAVLKETFGDAQYDLLKKAAARSKFLVGGERGAQGGGLFTQGLMFNIIFRPLQALPQFGALRALSYLLGRPRFTQWLAGEIPDKVFLKNDLPTLYDALGVGQPIRRAIGIQSIAEPVREAEEYGQRQFENQGIDPKSPIALELPEVEPANLSAQNQTTPSLNLLGGNMANMDIAQRLANLS